MRKLKDQIIQLIEADSREKVAAFSTAFARTRSEEKETLLAAMDFERWMAEICHDCLRDG